MVRWVLERVWQDISLIKTTGLLIPQPVESNPSKKPDDGEDPVPDPMYLPDPVDIEQDLCTAPIDPNPDDGTGQVSHHATNDFL